ncbi:hypothetical protein A2310_01585 [candidate division WOR-1 bacterium RIFOXYB2_FULL_37_13]|uniref:FlgD Ig-like domain-containing protein n=1 Tax=candidate division WOR-1 bacterium RIFOXYB2_FULL_37_13 TaxID=1802579 RepID=A0A1F4SPD3_UNCSA|nr:MAG: hypothetical protein A2310_01585 [candidate division WOR-1 bacterium RIFOXYB2_FULL_37_13]
MIGTVEGIYRGAGVFENETIEQVATVEVLANKIATLYFKINNISELKDDIVIQGEKLNDDFLMTFYDLNSGGSDITAYVLGSGYVVPLSSGISREVKANVGYKGNSKVTATTFITAVSSGDAQKQDKAKLVFEFIPVTGTTSQGAEGEPEIATGHATQEFTEADLKIPGMHITIPAGAVTMDVTVSVPILAKEPGSFPQYFGLLSKVFDIRASINEFLIPAVVTIPLDRLLNDPVKVYYWKGGSWSEDGITILGYDNNSLTFTTTHFTPFAAVGATDHNSSIFGPNPYNPNIGSARIYYWLFEERETSIFVINLAGSIVWRNSYAAAQNGAKKGDNNVEFDGKDSWGRVLSEGVYLYKIVQNGAVVTGGKISVIK